MAALLAPCAAAGVFVVVLALHLRRLVEGVFWNSDIASLPLIAGDVAHRAGGLARVSTANYASTFLFDLGTRWLPTHRSVWEGFSLAASELGVLLLAWAAHRAAGRAAGLVTLAIGVSASPILFFGPYLLRGPTWFSTGLLAATLALLPGATTRTRWLVVAAAGLLTGVNAASDPLLLVCGVAPLVGAAAGGWLLIRSPAAARVAAGAAAMAVVAGVVDLGTARLMRALGFRVVQTMPIGLAPLSRVPHNLLLLAHNIGAFGNEEFPRAPAGLLSVAGVVTVLLCALALAAPLRFLPAAARRRGEPGSLPLALFVLFWALAAAAVLVAFAFTTLPIGDVTSARYVVPVFLALAALVGVWASVAPWPQLGVGALATVFCIQSAAAVPGLVRYVEGYPLAAQGPAVSAFLESRGLMRGYASYWDALGITWQSGSRLEVRPVEECGGPQGRALCRFGFNVLTTWYRPRPLGRTFVLVGPQILPLEIADPPPPGLGTPAEVDHVGIFTVYVYEGDLAPRLG